MNAPRIATVLVVVALAVPTEALAQGDTLPVVGERVRAQVAPQNCLSGCVASNLRGTLTAVTADALVLELEGQPGVPRSYPLTSLERLEVVRGKKSATGIGAGVGCVAGALLGMSAFGRSRGEAQDLADAVPNADDMVEMVVFAGMGGMLGAGLGALIGSFIKFDRWEEVPLRELRIQPSPIAADAVSLSVSLRLSRGAER